MTTHTSPQHLSLVPTPINPFLERALTRIQQTAQLAGLPAAATAELWRIRQLTPTGQQEALARWAHCMSKWPTPGVGEAA